MAKKKVKKTNKKIEEERETKKDQLSEENTEEDKESGKIVEKSIETSHSNQLKWAVGIMIGILAIIMIFYGWKYMESQYDYMNLEFQKTQLGDVIFHSTRIPVTDQNNQITGSYSINFRNDPRDLEDILVPASPPAFITDKTVYVSIDPEMEACEMNSIAIVTLSSFLRDFASLDVEAAISDSEYAEANGFPYATCDNNLENTVISMKSGNETKIQKTGAHCYELTYANCEIMDVSEKFIIEVIREYMSYFKRV